MSMLLMILGVVCFFASIFFLVRAPKIAGVALMLLSVLMVVGANIRILDKRMSHVPFVMQVSKGVSYLPGPVYMWFWYDVESYSSAPIEINIEDAPGYTKEDEIKTSAEIASGDVSAKYKAIPLSNVDFSIFMSVNPKKSYLVAEHIGNQETLTKRVHSISRSMTREAIGLYNWNEFVKTKKTEVEETVRTLTSDKITALFVAKGVDPEVAKDIVIIEEVLRRNADLPSNMNDALTAKASASEELQLQTTLDQIATRVANRQKELGSGIKQSMSELPATVDIKDVIAYMQILPKMKDAETLAQFLDQHGGALANSGTVILNTGDNNMSHAVSTK